VFREKAGPGINNHQMKLEMFSRVADVGEIME